MDQGSHFTAFVTQGIRLSKDGKGRALDNIFIEPLAAHFNLSEEEINEMYPSRKWT